MNREQLGPQCKQWGTTRTCWVQLGATGTILGGQLGAFGTMLRPPGTILQAGGSLVGASGIYRDHTGASLGRLGPHCVLLGSNWEGNWCQLGPFWGQLVAFGTIRGHSGGIVGIILGPTGIHWEDVGPEPGPPELYRPLEPPANGAAPLRGDANLCKLAAVLRDTIETSPPADTERLCPAGCDVPASRREL